MEQCGPVSYQVEMPERRHIEQFSAVPEAVSVPVPTTETEGKAPEPV